MKQILLIIAFITSVFSIENDFLNPDQAFDVKIFEKKDSVDISIKLPKSIYLYDDKLKFFVDKTEVTKEVLKHKSEAYDEFTVHFGKFTTSISKDKIKEVIGDKSSFEVMVKYQGCSKKGLCYAPMKEVFKGSLGETKDIEQASANTEVEKDEAGTISDILTTGNIFLILATFFGFGLLLSLTPCIFPMIPILSSIIVKQSNKNDGKMSVGRGFFISLVYVLSMSAAYTIAGVMAGLFGANIQAMLQNPIVLIIFSGVFVALAFSLFGYFSLELPVSLQNKINKLTGENDNNGVAGVAIMGFLSALIVGPCVAPPLAGALIYIGQTGDAVLGGLALFVMSLGLGVPLLLVGAGAGKYMPKPGGWMETVSKVFGVIMLALAIYMLDRLVSQSITFALYAVLAIGSAFYLFKNSNNTFGKVVSVLLLLLAAYASYLSLTTKESHIKFQYVKTSLELDKILEKTTKPVMLDFWASWCVSCKELEQITFADIRVQEVLKNYTLLKIDVSANNEDDKVMMKRFNVFGPPALIFWNEYGIEEKPKRIIGYKNTDDFLKIINK